MQIHVFINIKTGTWVENCLDMKIILSTNKKKMKAIPKYIHNWKDIYIQTLEIHNLINSLTSNRFELRILYL